MQRETISLVILGVRICEASTARCSSFPSTHPFETSYLRGTGSLCTFNSCFSPILSRFAARLSNGPRTSKSTRKYTRKSTTHNTNIPRQSPLPIRHMCQECVVTLYRIPPNPRQPSPKLLSMVSKYQLHGRNLMVHAALMVSNLLAGYIQ